MVSHAQALMSRWQNGQAYDIDHEMVHLTMGIVSKTLFDADVSGEASEISEVVTDALNGVNARLDQLINIPNWMPTPEHVRFNRSIKRLDALIQRFIDDWRETGVDKGDLLSMLLLAQDEDGGGMSDRQVRDEAMTLFGAGHETTAAALMWTWYLLSQNPAAEARLLEELDSVLGGRAPELDDLAHLPYTERVIKEAMRLYPPAWSITRQAVADVEIGGLHDREGRGGDRQHLRDAARRALFRRPGALRPGAFPARRTRRLMPKYAYIPFGGGPRVCIGNAFAMMEAKSGHGDDCAALPLRPRARSGGRAAARLHAARQIRDAHDRHRA